MKPIQMVDTKTQYLKIKDAIRQGIQEVLESAAYINGPAVQRFTHSLNTYMGSKHTIPCANGTDALQIALMALGLQPGDEVITPSFTYIATTEVVALLRLKPVFVDVDPVTFCLDPNAVKKPLQPKQKPSFRYIYMGRLLIWKLLWPLQRHINYMWWKIMRRQSVVTIPFSNGTTVKTGTIGHIGCTSFYPSKNLGAYGDGGAIFTNDDALAEQLKMIANHGQKVRYYHDIVGCNSRLDAIQAAILDVKLKHLDEYIAARNEAAAFYNRAFANHTAITVPGSAPYTNHVYHQYTLVLNDVDRDAMNTYLTEQKIPSMIYYPVPGHKQKMFSTFGLPEVVLPVTDWLTERVISLPIHTELDIEQLEYITSHVLNFLNK